MTDAADRIVWEADEEALYRAARATEMAAQPQGAPEGVPGRQGAREALVGRIAEAIGLALATSWALEEDGHEFLTRAAVRAVLPLVDAEVAAAVSEAQAEVERLTSGAHNCLSTKIEAERADSAEAEVERLRGGIEALADSWDPPVTTALLQQGFGWDKDMSDMADDLRALLSPSPAAPIVAADQGSQSRLADWGGSYRDETDLVFCQRCGAADDNHAPGGSRYGACEFQLPTPVSSGEAATGEVLAGAVWWLADQMRAETGTSTEGWVESARLSYEDGLALRPAPVVTPSAEGSE